MDRAVRLTPDLPALCEALALLNANDVAERLDDVLVDNCLFGLVLVDNCLFGLSANFCFATGGDPAVREVMTDLAESYYDRAQGKTNLIAFDKGTRRLKAKDDVRKHILAAKTDDKPAIAAETFGFYIRHAPIEEMRSTKPVYEYFANVMYGERAQKRAGNSALFFHDSFANFTRDQDGYIGYFVECAERLDAFFACSGISIIPYSYSTSTVAQMWPIYRRFPGFHYAYTWGFRSDIERSADTIPVTNWLTGISAHLFDRVGGEAAARGALGPDIVLHRHARGVVFQAGPKPRLGDVNQNDIPEAYPEVARFLRPLRFENWSRPYLRVPRGVDAMDATREWVARFDRGRLGTKVTEGGNQPCQISCC